MKCSASHGIDCKVAAILSASTRRANSGLTRECDFREARSNCANAFNHSTAPCTLCSGGKDRS